MGEPNQFRKLRPDEPPARADDHQNHLLTEENQRLKDELRRAQSALRTAGRLLAPYVNK
jgi:hypothetical protein